MGDEAELRFVQSFLFAVVFLFLVINDMTVLFFFNKIYKLEDKVEVLI